jgi:hypothetical protein
MARKYDERAANTDGGMQLKGAKARTSDAQESKSRRQAVAGATESQSEGAKVHTRAKPQRELS